MDTVTIEDDQSDEESLGMLSSQGNVPLIHDTGPYTSVLQHIKEYPKEGEVQVKKVDEKMKTSEAEELEREK